MSSNAAEVYNDLGKWIEENLQFFAPPICNKMIHGAGQLKAFFVGGPNQRKDFHLEEGEEFFYQRKGDMVLVVMEQGTIREVRIREGEVFLLPGRIPHSPQRFSDTVGLVIERERMPEELDGLRYFVDGSTDILYEKWFYCSDLGTQLGPIIRKFFESEQYKTGRPIPGQDIEENAPWEPDSKRRLEGPFNLKSWIQANRDRLRTEGRLPLFSDSYASKILLLGPGNHEATDPAAETFVWQLEGTSVVATTGKEYRMKPDTSLLVGCGEAFLLEGDEDSIILTITMPPPAKVNRRATES